MTSNIEKSFAEYENDLDKIINAHTQRNKFIPFNMI